MSIPPMQPYPEMRSQPTDLYSELQYYTSEMSFDRASYAPIFEPFGQSAGSHQAQSSNMAARSAQTQLRALVPANQQDTSGLFSVDPFIDATENVGPTSFGVLKIRNVSPTCEQMSQISPPSQPIFIHHSSEIL